MARLGEFLVAAGLLTAEQVEQALRAQVLWGGRLGTNLVELHYLELDPLAKALGRQHRLPAALGRHFEKADPELQRRLSPEAAERFSCIPLLRMGPEGHVVVASLGPLAQRQLGAIAEQLAVDVARLVPAVAAELRIRYQLERVYGIRRAARFLRARGKSIPPFPAFQILPVQPDAEAEPAPPTLPTTTGEIAAYRPDGPRPRTEPGTGVQPRTAHRIAQRARSEPRTAAPAPAPAPPAVRDRAATEPDPRPLGITGADAADVDAAVARLGADAHGELAEPGPSHAARAAAADAATRAATDADAEAAAARPSTEEDLLPIEIVAPDGDGDEVAIDVDAGSVGEAIAAAAAAANAEAAEAAAAAEADAVPDEVDAEAEADATADGDLGVAVDDLGAVDDLTDLSGEAVLDYTDPGAPVEDEAAARERRTYVRTIADAPASDADRQALLGRIAIRKVAAGSAPRVMSGATLGEATRAIRRSTGRDRVADLVIDTLDRFAPACEAAILLVIRGATAIGWKGFQRAGTGLAEIAVPMDETGLVPRAVDLNVTLRGTATDLAPIDRLLLASLGRDDGDLVAVPISIAEQVMCVIAIATAENAPIACAEPIAAAAGAAFARLMRDASR